ncbi:alpha-L-glutamate ligase-like protein [Marinobacteraceae bacterium S3BR75-40.1]
MIRFATPRQLRRQGVLGMNERNADFVMRYNPRHLYPLVDDKLRTKELAMDAGIAVPELYASIDIEYETRRIESILAEHEQLVIKPAHGSGGNGIMVIDGRLGKVYRKASGALISIDNIRHHVSNILSGMYSLSGLPDQALFEYRVEFDSLFEHISYQGVPDIRVVVFRGVPVAAMVRLPTRASDGKANLHQGAVGVGIELASGHSSFGVLNNHVVEEHPDTGYSVMGLQIPHWDNLMAQAVRCADVVGLGYLGVDIVMDRTRGPLMLELNARPGLNVQIANQRGLLKNLERVRDLKHVPPSVEERIEFAKGLLDTPRSEARRPQSVLAEPC